MRTRKYLWSVALAVAVGGLYLANGREMGAGDTVPTNLLTITIARGDGFVLDRFRDQIVPRFGKAPYYVAIKGEHVVSLSPVAPALIAAPLAAPQLLLLDHIRPGWEHDAGRVDGYSRRIGKHCAAVIASLVAVTLFWALQRFGVEWFAALLASGIAAAGSSLWTVASQSLWQHGPAALALTLSLALLPASGATVFELLLSGAAVGMMVACRPIDLILALPIATWVLVNYRRRSLLFVAPSLVIAALLIAYNVAYFQNVEGGYAELESATTHAQMHAVTSAWTPRVLDGAVGTLFSPSRGLLVFTPWVALALAVLPWNLKFLHGSVASPLVRFGLPGYLLVLSAYSVWWAGWSFGPRYWTDTIPVFAILLGFGLQWSWREARNVFVGFVVAAFVAITIQAIGAFCYDASWNAYPTNVDLHHERLWNWYDNVIFRSALTCVAR